MTVEGAYTHLEVHSHYSLLAGTASVADLAARAAREGMRHLALTDSNVLYGAVAFARACEAEKIEPIIGMAVDVAAPDASLQVAGTGTGRLLLLATGPAGYRSLCHLSSHLQGDPERATHLRRGLSWDTLRRHRAGLLCIEAGRGGWLARLLQAGKERAAGRYLSRLGAIFQDHAYVGLEWQRPADEPVVRAAYSLGQRFGLPPVALQPVYCLEPEERETLRLLAAIRHNCTLETVPREALPGEGDPTVDVHWLPAATVAERFAALPEAVAEVGALVQRCRPPLPSGDPIWPALSLPEGETAATALVARTEAGCADRYGDDPAAQNRLKKELETITGRGYAPLFLVVADIVRFARAEGIPVSTRGSVANSLVAYCLQITTVDPVAHDLLFARFLNPARRGLPDIDLDFSSSHRDRVLAYVREHYGPERVALVGAMNHLQTRSAVRETAKAYGFTETEIKALSARLPGWREERTLADVSAETTDSRERTVLAAAARIVGQPHHLGVHAGGVVITPGPLPEVVPVQWAAKGFLATQYDYRDLEAIGLPKLDLLGIRALTVLAGAAILVRAHHESEFRVENIPLDDSGTARLLRRAETIGVFQCESTGAQRTLRQLQAATVRDLAVANAFFKPGPAMGGMADAFIRRYRGEEPVTYLHPALEPILAPTQGVLLFQEQVLRLAREVAGLSWAQADRLRRGMSKMRSGPVLALRLAFVEGCRRPPPSGPGMDEATAEQLWEQVVPFAGYGFNQGHATAYADVTYRSAYLKAHYPAEFLCARLQNGGGFHYPAVYIAEARRLGIAVHPPHANVSGRRFTLTYEEADGYQEPHLWLGLGWIRSLRRASIEALVAARQEAPFSGLRDLLGRVSLRDKEVRHLIQAGALDGLGENRATLLAEAAPLLRADNAHQLTFAFAAPPAVEPETAAERLAWEQHLLGLPVSVHPLETVAREGEWVPLRQVPGREGPLTVAGVRLPGRTGGPGFFLDDGRAFVLVKGMRTPRPWQPLAIRGRWRRDRWGSGWLQAEGSQVLPAT